MDQNRKLPIIGITADSESAGGYSKFPWYALRQNYAASVKDVGGMPVVLAHEPELVPAYLDMIDALIVTGGAFDVDPALYGASETHESVVTKDERTQFEWAITKGALERQMPVLGICGGQQLLNVVLGGSLIQHIPDSVPACLPHEQPNPRDEVGHDVSIVEGSLLHRLTGVAAMGVNSAHHQAVERVGEGTVVSASAQDGVIEAIEHPGYRYCLGVQWHPEFLITPGDRAVMSGLIAAAGE